MRTRNHPTPIASGRPPRGRRAFTLLEVVIAVLVMAILAAVATPQLGNAITHHRAKAAALRIGSDLQRAQRAARLAGASRSVVFDVAANRYSLPGLTDPDHPGQAFTVDLAATGYPASLLSVSLGPSGTSTSITFDMYGRPDAGGSITLRSGGDQRTIQIDPLSGRVTVP